MASNLRVLVSNVDGNWGHYIPNTGAVDTANELTGAGSVYFPPGSSKGTPPTESDMFFSTDLSGWTSKSNWIIQLTGNFNSQTVSVHVGRPTGVEETIIVGAGAALAWGGGSSIDLTAGSPVEVYENIVGPVSYFRFQANGAVTSVKCYVIAWNEGDICDAVGRV
jgi:hypothetical protein